MGSKFIYLSLFLTFFISNYGISQTKSKWQFKTKGKVFGSPVVENSRIYFGSGDHKIYALDLNTGLKKWEFTTGGEVRSSPFLSGELVLCGSADGVLYALEKSNGKLVWKFSSQGEKVYGLWDYYLSSPKADDGLIYWGSGDSHLYAIDLSTGQLRWKFQTGGIIHADPVIEGNKVFIGSFDGNLYALDKNNGKLIWKFKTLGAQYFPKGEIQKAVLVDEQTVYFGSRDYNIYALDVLTGMVKWNMREPAGWIIATPVVYGDHLFFGTSDAHKFYSVHKNTGMTIWDLSVRMRVYGSATIYDDLVYFGTFDGKILAADIKTGEKKWEFQTNGSRMNYHTVFNEEGTFKEGFSLYGTDMKETENKILDLGAVLGTPVIHQNVIYFGSADGYLYAIPIQN